MGFNIFDGEFKADIKLGRAMLDCGAFSVLTGLWADVPLDRYETFVRDYHKHFKLIAAPDVIGSATKTLDNLVAYVNALSDISEIIAKTVYTYHLTDLDLPTFEKGLEYAWDVGIRWLALGGIASTGKNEEERWVGMQEVTRIVHKLNLPFKIHLFGGYKPEYIKHLQPDSIDSATYIAAAKNLVHVGYNGWEMTKEKLPKDSHTDYIDRVCRIILEHQQVFKDPPNYTTLYKELNVLPLGTMTWLVNLIDLVAFEKFVHESGNTKFKYWVTINPSMPVTIATRYSPQIRDWYQEMWKNRCLIAFPSFYQYGTTTFMKTDHLEIFKE